MTLDIVFCENVNSEILKQPKFTEVELVVVTDELSEQIVSDWCEAEVIWNFL